MLIVHVMFICGKPWWNYWLDIQSRDKSMSQSWFTGCYRKTSTFRYRISQLFENGIFIKI